MAKENSNGANLGFESELWRAADALRSNMDAAEYKHVVLGLIFLKYISDAFEEQHAKLEADRAQGADPEDPDEYRAVNIFWVKLILVLFCYGIFILFLFIYNPALKSQGQFLYRGC